MRMKNKMKDSKVKFEEWWEVVEEYFTKELEKNLAQHKANEKILRYKLEVYQKNFPEFIYGNPTSIEESGQDEEIETRPGGTTSKEEVQIKESHDLKKVEQLRNRYNQRYHNTLKEGVRKKKNQREFRNRKRWKLV